VYASVCCGVGHVCQFPTYAISLESSAAIDGGDPGVGDGGLGVGGVGEGGLPPPEQGPF
jgi:hypothetical protein